MISIVARRLLAAVLIVLATVAAAEAASRPDPFAHGPLGATLSPYDFTPRPGGYATLLGEGAKGPVPLKTTFRGEVAFPNVRPRSPSPLILVMHGLAPTCVDSGGRPVLDQWPCVKPGLEELPSYAGYRQLATLLASHGYVVASIDASAVTDLPTEPDRVTDMGDSVRAELIRRHIAFWQAVNRGEVERLAMLAGLIDFGRIGVVGHSRGGSGVVRFAVEHRNEPAGPTLRALALIAPDNTYPETGGTIARVPLPFLVLAPYCDASVDDLNGLLFYEDARYEAYARDNWNAYGVLLGANHNYFNSVWAQTIERDDWAEFAGPARRDDPHCGPASPDRLTGLEQGRIGAGYVAMFLRWQVGGERAWAPFIQGLARTPGPSTGRGQMLMTVQPPERHRLLINPLRDSGHLATNTLGGSVSMANAVTAEICPRAQDGRPVGCVTGRTPDAAISPYNEPHAVELTALAVDWRAGKPLSLINELPPGTGNLAPFEQLQVRIGLDYGGGLNARGLSGFRFILRDTAGRTAVLPLPSRSPAARKMPGRPGDTARLLLHAVQVPLAGAARSVDLAAIRSIELRTGRSGPGRIVLADLIAWRTDAAPAMPRPELKVISRRGRGPAARPPHPRHS